MQKEIVEENRSKFLSELRSGNHNKGTIRSDDKGNPIIESEDDNNGHCACAIFTEMYGAVPGSDKLSIKQATSAIGITTKDCGYIQREINDTDLNFNQIADRIEKEVFNKPKMQGICAPSPLDRYFDSKIKRGPFDDGDRGKKY